MDRLVEYARSVKGKDGQGRASQVQARSTGMKMHRAFHGPRRTLRLGGYLGAEPLPARSMKRLFDGPSLLGKTLSVLREIELLKPIGNLLNRGALGAYQCLTGTLTKPTLRAAPSPPSDHAYRNPQ